MKTLKWSQEVTDHSHALALEPGVFAWKDPRKIAASLKRSSLNSTARKASPYQSAMSMLNFYINRAGKKLKPEQKEILTQAKEALGSIFNKAE